jgi:hypothetical protein
VKTRQALVSNSSSSSYYFICSSRRKLLSKEFTSSLALAREDSLSNESDLSPEALASTIYNESDLIGTFLQVKDKLVHELKEGTSILISYERDHLAWLEKGHSDPGRIESARWRITALEDIQSLLHSITKYEEVRPLLQTLMRKESLSRHAGSYDEQRPPLSDLHDLFYLSKVLGRDSNKVYYLEIGDSNGLIHNGFHYFHQEGLLIIGDVLVWAVSNH